jgi:hypothetical protein
MRHQHGGMHIAQDITGRPAQNPFPKPRPAISAHDDEIRTTSMRGIQYAGARLFIGYIERACRDIHAVPAEIIGDVEVGVSGDAAEPVLTASEQKSGLLRCRQKRQRAT